MNFILKCIVGLIQIFIFFGDLNAEIQKNHFPLPEKLKGRVKFWVDIFAKYGKDNAVIHHRMYPQVVFSVLDFSEVADTLGPIALDVHKKKRINESMKRVEMAARYLGAGGIPRDDFEKAMVKDMSFVPGGINKYRRMVTDDLIRSQTGIKEKFRDAIIRSGRYMSMMERIFAENNLPIELTRLPFVESSFDYTAYSSVGAAGIWQFMPRTGRAFNLIVNNAIDERRDPVSATRAAAKYLENAYAVLGSWPLALTSYNHGVYGVSKAVKKMGTRDIGQIVESHGERPFGFASNNFYPEFLAALEVYRNRRYYFSDVVVEPPLKFKEVKLARSIYLRNILRELKLDKETLGRYNYALLHRVMDGVVPVPSGYVLRVPVELYDRAKRLNTIGGIGSNDPLQASNVRGGVSYRVRKGDSLLRIAKKFGVSVKDLMRTNALKNYNIQTSQTLTIPQRR